MLCSSTRSVVFRAVAPIYSVGTLFHKILTWGAIIGIPLNFLIFGIAYNIDNLSLQLLSIANIALLSIALLKE